MKKTILIIFLLAAGSINSYPQGTFNYDSLSIARVLQYGLESNFDIRMKWQVVNQSQGQVQTNKGAFNPSLNVTGYGFYGTDPTVTFFDSYYVSGQFLLPTRFGAKFYTGFKLSTMTEIISGVPDYYPSTNMAINESGMWAGVTMPLLRDFGSNNSSNASFKASLMMNKAQNISFSDEVCVFIKNTLSYYYNSYLRLKIWKILSDAEKDAKEYLNAIEEMIKAEQIPKAEIYRAKAYETNINQQYDAARNEINKSLYDLITSIGGKGSLSAREYPRFLDSLPDPSKFPWENYSMWVLNNVDTLISHTSYIKSQKMSMEASKIEMKAAKYNKMNELNLDLRYYYFGSTAYQPFSDFNQTFTSGSPGSSVNLTLTYKLPFSNDVQKGLYVTKLSSYELNKTQLEKTVFNSKMQVFQLLSDLGNLIKIFKNQIELAALEKRTFDNEVQKFKMGTSTQINVINTYMDYNNALLTAENGRQAIITKVIILKYLIGDFPTSSEQLLKYNLWDFSVKN
jgi:outer membrane protein TolC